jgi:hypothetical protein
MKHTKTGTLHCVAKHAGGEDSLQRKVVGTHAWIGRNSNTFMEFSLPFCTHLANSCCGLAHSLNHTCNRAHHAVVWCWASAIAGECGIGVGGPGPRDVGATLTNRAVTANTHTRVFEHNQFSNHHRVHHRSAVHHRTTRASWGHCCVAVTACAGWRAHQHPVSCCNRSKHRANQASKKSRRALELFSQASKCGCNVLPWQDGEWQQKPSV